MALVKIYNPASGNFAYAPERAVDKGALPKWRRARPEDKPRAARKVPGAQQASASTKKSSDAAASTGEKESN